jgi:hypothetical protein
VDYSTVMEDFSDHGLIANVLRARDRSPLIFSDLTIIRGSIASQASLSVNAVLQGVAPGEILRDWKLPNAQSTQNTKPDEHQTG